MKKYLILMLAMMAGCMMTSCGDDKDDDPGSNNGYVEKLTGVHRIDVIVPEEMKDAYGVMVFTGLVNDKVLYSKLYEDGIEVESYKSNTYAIETMRSASVYTSADASSLVLSFVATDLTTSYDVIVKAYYNGKLVKAETVTVSPGKNRGSFTFSTYGGTTLLAKLWEYL